MEIYVPAVITVLLMSGSFAGWLVRHVAGERHRSNDTVDALRLVMSMMVTFAALVLGLLTSSAKSDFDASVRGLQSFGMSLTELDQRLREYGAEAEPVRRTLRAYTAAALVDTWPNEPAPSGDYLRPGPDRPDRGIENFALADLLIQVDKEIAGLVPATPVQRQLAPLLVDRMSAVLQRRWEVLAGTTSRISWPFLNVLLLWLTLAFFMFGLSNPPNRLTAIVLVLAAISMAAAVYLIIDFGTPLSGLLTFPSSALRNALLHMDRPGP